MKKFIVKHGDVVILQGTAYTIERVLYQDYYDESWEEHGWFLEFYDINGKYHYWKQYLDGGKLIQKGDKI